METSEKIVKSKHRTKSLSSKLEIPKTTVIHVDSVYSICLVCMLLSMRRGCNKFDFEKMYPVCVVSCVVNAPFVSNFSVQATQCVLYALWIWIQNIGKNREVKTSKKIVKSKTGGELYLYSFGENVDMSLSSPAL